MGRLVVIIVLVVLAVWLVRKALRAAATGQETKLRRGEAAVNGELVRCAHCGVHLPRVEAREKEGALYCSEEHARLGKR
jgi:uncharacterized protein